MIMLQGDGLAASKGCIMRLCMSMKVEEGGYKGDEGEKRQRTQGCARLIIVTYFRLSNVAMIMTGWNRY